MGFLHMAILQLWRRSSPHESSVLAKRGCCGNKPALQLGCRWRSVRVFMLSKHRVYDAASCVRRRSGWETDRVLPKALYGSWEHFAQWGYGVRTVDGALVLNDGLDDSRQVQDADVEHERVAITKIQDCSSHRIPIVCRDAWKVYLPPNSDVFGLFSGLFFRWIRGFCR